MKKIFILPILILLTSFCYSQSKDGFLKDLKIYKEIVETSHSGMYLYTSKEDFSTIFKKAKDDINADKITTYKDFFLLIATIHTKINCGHSSVYPGSQIQHAILSKLTSIPTNKTLFPVNVKFAKDTLVVTSNYQTLKKGSKILKINGKLVDEIVKEFFKIISSDGFNTTFKYRQLEDQFQYYYLLLYDTTEKFDLEIIPYQSDDKKSITIDAISIKDSTEKGEKEKKKAKKAKKKKKPILDLTYIDTDTALLTVNSFDSELIGRQKKYFKFLSNSFKEIKKKNIKNLILDIRENTGGDDGNDMELASYLINKPFKENKFRELNTLNLPLYPEYLHPSWRKMLGIPKKATPEKIKEEFKKETAEEFYLEKNGHYYYKDKYVIKRDPNKYLFTGKVYILISGNVFSGGGLFSALVRDKSNAIFVGEETGGGYYRHTGTIPLYYTLPYSKVMITISIVINEQDVDQKLFPNGSGTVPQIEIYPTVDDILEGKDTVLNFVKRKIKEK